MIARWIFAFVFGTFVSAYAVAVGVTGWWTMTGHCCGSPLLGADWDACLPVQDKYWLTQKLGAGHCDRQTWKRVP